MKSKLYVLLTAAVCALLLTACKSGRSLIEAAVHGELADNTFQQKSEHLNIGDSYAMTDGLKSGILIYTCTNAYYITNVSDIPAGGGFADDAMVVFADNGKDGIAYQYPDFINEDGSFVDGVYMLMAEVTVKSENAEQYTTDDLDDEGYPMGQFESPYLFAFNLELVDTSLYYEEKGAVPRYYAKVYDYCGWMNEINELGDPDREWCLFRLEPGEERNLTMGYLVSSKDEGGLNDLTSLCLAYYGGGVDYNVFVDLDYTEGEE